MSKPQGMVVLLEYLKGLKSRYGPYGPYGIRIGIRVGTWTETLKATQVADTREERCSSSYRINECHDANH